MQWCITVVVGGYSTHSTFHYGAGCGVGSNNNERTTMNTSITCPQCGMVSHHPQDIEQQYCGNCHQYHADIKARADGWRDAEHRAEFVRSAHTLAEDIRALVHALTVHECSGVHLSSLPPKGANHIALRLCPFRWRFYALRYGGHGGHGIGYEWLGV